VLLRIWEVLGPLYQLRRPQSAIVAVAFQYRVFLGKYVVIEAGKGDLDWTCAKRGRRVTSIAHDVCKDA